MPASTTPDTHGEQNVVTTSDVAVTNTRRSTANTIAVYDHRRLTRQRAVPDSGRSLLSTMLTRSPSTTTASTHRAVVGGPTMA